jgi:hypothetical protein
MTPSGAIGVHATLSRPVAKDKDDIPKRFIECRNGHGVVGQIYSKNLEQWCGACPTCGDTPPGELGE